MAKRGETRGRPVVVAPSGDTLVHWGRSLGQPVGSGWVGSGAAGADRLRRGLDVTVAALGLVALAPVFAVIAVGVKLDSAGPVFYRGVRTGRYGVPFAIFKFRTMVRDAERLGGGSTAKNDPRVTRFGRFLRRHKLDELPQLLNVLRGEMGLVGPRPELPQYTKLYAGDEQLILSVRPGITDLASLEFIDLGERLGNEEPDRVYEEEVRPIKNALRVKYVKERTLRGDIRIVARTLARVVAR